MNLLNTLAEVVGAGFRPPHAQPPRVLVLGDLMLDRYLWGRVERISPEAPVPVVRLENETERLGGAGNVAANLAGLGLDPVLIAQVGADADGDALKRRLGEVGIDSGGLIVSAARPTIAKTRVIGGHQQMLRLDREQVGPLPDAERERLHRAALAACDRDDLAAVLLSDYAKGVLDPELCQAVIRRARARGLPVLVDPKGRDWARYRGATSLTPNQHELATLTGVAAHDTAALLAAGEGTRAALGLDFLTLTRGEHGIALLQPDAVQLIPAQAQAVFDVSGAGDTVIATLTAALVGGIAPAEACHLANVAAGIVVGQVGTAPIERDALLHALEVEEAIGQADKIVRLDALQRRVAVWRARGDTIVFTNGCFDLLHAGHVTYLEAARQLGQRLIVGLNTDRSVRALKGPQRPVIDEHDRARVLAALEAVDAVILFDEDTPLALIQALRPDVLVKGSDYREDQVVGGAEVRAWGGRVELVQLVPGRSTSGIVARIGT